MESLDDTPLMHLFTVPFMSYRWPDVDDLNLELRERILAREQVSPGQHRTNVGGWQSTEDFHKWTGEAGEKLVDLITELANHATSHLFAYYKTQDELKWGMALWANVNRAGQYNNTHIHPGATWSGVYYADTGSPVPEQPHSGDITFLSPILPQTYSFFTKALPSQYTIKPEAGRMVLFPSYLQHQVHPYWGEQPRISVAFNIKKDPFP